MSNYLEPVLTDVFGQEINVGDYVAYPTTSDRSPVLRIGTVEKLTWKAVSTYHPRTGPGPASLVPAYQSEEMYVAEQRESWNRRTASWPSRYGVYGGATEASDRDTYRRHYAARTGFGRSVQVPYTRYAPTVTTRGIADARYGHQTKKRSQSVGRPTPTNLLKVTPPEGFLDA